MSSSPISLCSPWNSRLQTRTRIHEPVAGAQAGASGSRRRPKGGSRGRWLLPRPGGDALPPPCLPVVHTPFGLRSRGAGVVGGALGPALPAPLLPGTGGRGAAGPGARVLPPPPPSPCSHLRLLVHLPSRPVAAAQTAEWTAEGERAPEDTELALDCLFAPQVMSEVGRSQDLKSNRVLRIE